MQNRDYEEKKKRELEFYEKERKDTFFSKILHLPIFCDPIRAKYNYSYVKNQMSKYVSHQLRGKKIENILIAPCGKGVDYQYLSSFASEIYGIDLSPLAIKKCPMQMKTKVGDILDSEFPSEKFDLIASPLFFHHIVQFGFDPFLKEFNRILKKGGYLIIVEPSVFYPINAITRPMKKILKNPFGEVEDEGAFRPKLMIESLKRTGYVNIRMEAASFSHVSFFIPLAKVVNRITKPLFKKWLFKTFAWMVLFWAEKKK